MGILSWIVVGLVAGWLAGLVMNTGFGILGNILIGMVGGLLGGWLAGALFGVADPLTGFNIGTVFISFIGAVLLIALIRLVRGERV